MKRLLPLALLGVIVVWVLGGSSIRNHLGVEYTPESLQAFILGLGAMAPIIFVVVMTFRSFLLLPSMMVLTVGGLVFGAGLGTLLGCVGILLSSLMMFGVARGVRRGWLHDRLIERFQSFEERIEAAGPIVIGLTTAHPMGPMSPFHWAAGLSSIPLRRFLLVILVAGSFRAFAYSLFGSTLLDVGSPEFYIATVGLLAVVVLPLCHRGLREKVLARGGVR